ncbi:hypothetical protein N2W54_006830 [Lotmaria passim]
MSEPLVTLERVSSVSMPEAGSSLSASLHVSNFKRLLDRNVVEASESNAKKSRVGPHLGSRMHSSLVFFFLFLFLPFFFVCI